MFKNLIGHTRAIAGMIVIILFVVFSNLNLITIPVIWVKMFKENSKVVIKDDVTSWEESFLGIRKYLPDHGTVGFITDQDGNRVFINPDTTLNFYLTQYSIAPNILENSLKPHFVIGVFKNSQVGKQLYSKKNLIVAKDFGNGKFLLRNRTK